MKVILLKDVKGMGRAHEAVEAKDGHALNYLIPQKLAVPATPTAQKAAETRRKQAEERREVDKKLFEQNLETLAEARIVIRAKANEKGHLYDAIGEREIARAAKEQVRVELPEESVKLERPFKELGTFDVPVALGDTFGKFSITIEAE